MPPTTDTLRRILDLEAARGYADSAVAGGIERFLPRWLKVCQTSPDLLPQAERVATALAGYASRPPAERARMAAAALRLLAEPRPAPAGVAERPRAAPRADRGPTAAPVPTPAPSPSRPRAATPRAPARSGRAGAPSLDSPVEHLPAVGPATARLLARVGVATLRDLLFLLPRRYEDFSRLRKIAELGYGQQETIVGEVWEIQSRRTRTGRNVVSVVLADETGMIEATWFNPFAARSLRHGMQVRVSGKIDQYLGRLTFSAPEWEPVDQEELHTGRLVPIYPLTEGLRPRQLRRLARQAVSRWAGLVPEQLPAEMRARQSLLDITEAIEQIHFPDSLALADRARERLAFEELLLIQLGVLRRKRAWQQQAPATPVMAGPAVLSDLRASLPFALTVAQERVLAEIFADLARPVPANRLLQGDVGSGKTVVAAAALLATARGGLQGALMAPTEILAEQHFHGLSALLEPLGLRLAFLRGGQTRRLREQTLAAVRAGEVEVVVGTHAVIQEGVVFARLGLAVIDEQHRFGVVQRAALRQKGHNPHLLVMTATPIPRSLAMTVYGDLDLSTIDEMPPGRQEIKTRWLPPEQRDRAYAFMRAEVQAGRQVFIICPLVEESEKIEARAATAEYERLQAEVFPEFALGLLHGRMSQSEKDAVMHRFRDGELQMLVATSVVEVGIDVPNATVMLIEGADRFGLSQLHQFRGRVGRGSHQSYCLLLAESISEVAAERLDTVARIQDGFRLAEKDLELRGPGELLGTRQSGMPDLRAARLTDVQLLQRARTEAERLLAADPELSRPAHQGLREEVERIWADAAGVS